MRPPRGAVIALLTLLAACAADVRLEDDDGTGNDGGDDAASDDGDGRDDDGADGGGAGDAGSATSGTGSQGDLRSELQVACNAICTTRCTATRPDCEGECATVIDACVAERLAVIRCITPGSSGPCPEEADPEACREERDALRECNDAYDCGHSGHAEETVCDVENNEVCDCHEQCDDGHFSEISCRVDDTSDFSQICDCYFDGAYVGECRDLGNPFCYATGSCCMPLLR